MIETRRLKDVVIFVQTILSFVLSRKIINIYNNIARKYGNFVTLILCFVTWYIFSCYTASFYEYVLSKTDRLTSLINLHLLTEN